jgi:hypothetical protein
MSQSFTTYSRVKVGSFWRVHSHTLGIAELYYYGIEGDFNVMIMEILGPTLYKMFDYCD